MHEEKHVKHYLLLVVGIFVVAILFVFFKYNLEVQSILAFIGSLYYILWGIIHHIIERRITKLIALEYILVGVFVFVLIFTALRLS
jgi:uncharacterized membrane protein